MSTPAPELVAPSDAFLAQGAPSDRFLTDNLPSVEDAPEDEHHHRAVIAIAGAFIAWRMFYVARARREIPVPPVEPEYELARLFMKVGPAWLRVAGPSIVTAMEGRGLTGDELQAVAADYAARLGRYVHDTSAAAVVAGYRESLRRGTSPTLSWLRALEGYGLEERRLRSWVAQQGAESPIADLITPGARSALDRAMLARADLLGQTEAWHARQVAKSIAWLYADQVGDLPRGTRKRWLTAHDEKVCPICGPLDQKLADLDAKFELPDGQELWAPGVHPNCRCELVLVYPSFDVEKAAPGDPYDRDRRGRFATQEARVRERPREGAPVAEREADPAVVELAETMARGVPEEVPNIFGPKQTTGPDIFGTQTPQIFRRGGSTPDVFGTQPQIFPTPTIFQPPQIFPQPDIFGQAAKVPLYILVGGEPRQTAKDKYGIIQIQNGIVALLVDDYHHTLDPHHRVDEPPARRIYHVGDPVDLRSLNTFKYGKNDPPLYGYVLDDNKGGVNDVLDQAATSYYPTSSDRTADYQEPLGNIFAFAETFHEMVYSTPAPYVFDLNDYQIETFMRDHMGEEYDTNFKSPDQMRQDLIVAIHNGNDELASGLANRLIELELADATGGLADDLEVLVGEVGTDYLQVPQVFSFPHGFEGEWGDDSHNPKITGRYQVMKIIHHPLSGGESSERFLGWDEIQLRPIGEPDQEH